MTDFPVNALFETPPPKKPRRHDSSQALKDFVRWQEQQQKQKPHKMDRRKTRWIPPTK